MDAPSELTEMPQVKEAAIAPKNKPHASSKQQKTCPSCGGTDHQRKSSKKCPFYLGHVKPLPEAASTLPSLPDMDATCFDSETMFDTVSVLTGESNSPTKLPAAPTISTKTAESNISKPTFIALDSEDANRRYATIVDAMSFRPTETSFKLLGKDHREREIEIVPTVSALMDKFLPSSSHSTNRRFIK